MQVRHGLTSHGFAINVTKEPILWFDQVIACGLVDVRAASVQSVQRGEGTIDMMKEKKLLAELFGEMYGKEIRELGERDGEIWDAVKEMEDVADKAGEWLKRPIS